MVSNIEFINLLLEQAKQFFTLSMDPNDEEAYKWYDPACNCLDAAYALANYNEPLNFAEESGLTLESDIHDIEMAVFELTQPQILKYRTEDEILDYHREAEQKVWYCRTRECTTNPELEEKRKAAVAKIEATYGDSLDILRNPESSDWGYGYYSGIMAALRWVLGEYKEELYT